MWYIIGHCSIIGTYCTHTVLAFPLIGLSTMYYERATNYDTNVLANCITITRNNRVPSYTGFISSTFIVPIGRCYGIVTCGDGENDKDLYCICTIDIPCKSIQGGTKYDMDDTINTNVQNSMICTGVISYNIIKHEVSKGKRYTASAVQHVMYNNTHHPFANDNSTHSNFDTLSSSNNDTSTPIGIGYRAYTSIDCKNVDDRHGVCIMYANQRDSTPNNVRAFSSASIVIGTLVMDFMCPDIGITCFMTVIDGLGSTMGSIFCIVASRYIRLATTDTVRPIANNVLGSDHIGNDSNLQMNDHNGYHNECNDVVRTTYNKCDESIDDFVCAGIDYYIAAVPVSQYDHSYCNGTVKHWKETTTQSWRSDSAWLIAWILKANRRGVTCTGEYGFVWYLVIPLFVSESSLRAGTRVE